MILVLPFSSLAQDADRYDLSGSVTPGAQLTNDPASSKFNEYRDIEDGVFIPGFRFDAYDTDSGRFLEFRGRNAFRDDQNFQARAGEYGRWSLGLEWDELPHLLSNRALSPYTYQGDGSFTVPTTVSTLTPGFVKDLVPSAAELTGTNDPAIANYLSQYLQRTDLKNDRKKGSAVVEYSLPTITDLKFRLAFSNEDRDGNKVTYGPIGDRPPRSLNIQMPEPIEHQTRELKFETDYAAEMFNASLAYTYSDFDNDVPSMTWQNIYAGTSGTEETWTDNPPPATNPATRNVAIFGRRALAPKNQSHQAMATVGVDLPFDSRLTGTASFARTTQDESLLPYSTNATAHASGGGVAWNDAAKLPRTSADAKMNTRLYNLDYAISPVDRLNVRAFYRFHDLDNNTPMERWWYVTGDTTGTTGSVSFKNKRVNLPHAYDKQNVGAEAGYGLGFLRTNVGFGFEREDIDRPFREANTDENIYRVSLRMRPLKGLSFRTKYQYGDREGKNYNNNVSTVSYWYSPTEITDSDNPQFTFNNHPDTRRYDVSDRKRKLFDFIASTSVLDKLDVGASYRYRNDNFDSDVAPTQPLINVDAANVRPGATVAEFEASRALFTPGAQIGLLRNIQHRGGVDLSYPLSERLTLAAFGAREDGKSLQRGIEYNENNKENPTNSSVVSSELGPWTRASSQWVAETRDQTSTVGIGAGIVILPDKLSFSTDHTFSQGEVDITYSGFGTVSSLDPATALPDNHQFAFRTPTTVNTIRYTGKVGIDYQVVRDLMVGFGYMFERYHLSDWQQDPNTPWVETVGNDNFQRDTSSATSTQWGNRLPNMGPYLAPSYVAHVGTVTMTYKF